MIARRAADLAYILERSGVIVTLGGASTSGLVAAADERVLQDAGTPVALIGKAVLVRIQKDTLAGLASNATLTVTEGDLAGAYRIDRILGDSDGALTAFLAYPTEATPAPAFWSRGSELLAWDLRFIDAVAGDAFDLDTVTGTPVLVFEAEPAVAGEAPQLLVTLLHCATLGGTYVDSGIAIARIFAAGGMRVLVIDRDEVERYVKVLPVITSIEGPGPVDPDAVNPAFQCGAGVLDVTLPRT